MAKRVLFICSGNTCRSPMAAALFRDAVAKDPTCRESGIEARSAGTVARDGEAATELAVTAMRRRGVGLINHRATRFSQEAAEWADVILTMTKAHRQTVVGSAPAAGAKTFTIAEYVGDDAEVGDPLVEAMPEAYERCAAQLSNLIRRVLARMSRR